MEQEGVITVRARTGGIKIEGSDQWLNPSKAVEQYVMSLNRGDKVKYSLGSDGKVSYITKIGESTIQQPTPQPTRPQATATQKNWDNKDLLMALCNAWNGVAQIYSARIQIDEGAYKTQTAEEICRQARHEALATVIELHRPALSQDCFDRVVAQMKVVIDKIQANVSEESIGGETK